MEPTWEQQLDAALAEAMTLRDNGDRPGAVRKLEGVATPVKLFGIWHYARGTLALEQGDIPLAVREFEAAVQAEPLVPEFRANLGAALLEKVKNGDKLTLPRVLKLLQEAVNEEPKLPHVHVNYGVAKLVAGDAAGALVAFDRALALDPQHLPALYNRAGALDGLGKHAEALAALDKVLKLDPKHEAAIESRARVAAKLKA